MADSLNDGDRRAVDELRRRIGDDLKDDGEYGSDYMLLRWLMGFDYDIEDILPRVKHTIQVRRAIRMTEINFDNIDDIKTYMDRTFTCNILKHFPGGVAGTDRKGNIVVVDPVGRCDPRGLMPAVRVSEFLRWRLCECEAAAALVRAQEKRLGRKCGIVYISDVDGLSLEQIWMPAMHIYIQLLVLMQQHFPDFLTKVFIIRYPAVVHAAYKMIYPVLSKQTRNKIEFVSGDWKKKLCELIDPSDLPSYWGGANNNNTIYGHVRMGGKMPKELRYNPSTNPEEVPDSQLQSTVISRGTSWQLRMQCDTAGSRLRWFFRLQSGDVGFSIYLHRADEKPLMMMPRFKINTDFVPEWGEMVCDSIGDYVLEFDNSHSYIRSKTVLYKVTLVPP